jgi:hypothetical protein
VVISNAARLTDWDVIIARTDLPSSRLKVSNPKSHNFTATLVIPSAIPGLSVIWGGSVVQRFAKERCREPAAIDGFVATVMGAAASLAELALG